MPSAVKKVAVIGAGAAGLTCAYHLREHAAVRIFEAQPRAGGHAHTDTIQWGNRTVEADTAFMVYNHRNYPHFSALLNDLGVAGRETSMSFSVSHQAFGLEYNGGSLAGLIADKRNLMRGEFWRLLSDIASFNRQAKRDLSAGNLSDDDTLSDYLTRHPRGRYFSDAYLLPMGAAIWSCSREEIAAAPALFALSFFNNYGLLDLAGRPQWLHVAGGSKRYVEALINRLDADAVCVGQAVENVCGDGNGRIRVRTGGQEEIFDAAVLAVHAPDAVTLISDLTATEREILGGFRYTDSEAALHDDISILPARKNAWACWNYRVWQDGGEIRACSTYNLSLLQHLGGEYDAPLLLTLNDGIGRLDPARILTRYRYAHPLPDTAAMRARRRAAELNGKRGLFFCGAYWGNGFHEDAAASGLAAAQAARQALELA